jgi:hypothetical protein
MHWRNQISMYHSIAQTKHVHFLPTLVFEIQAEIVTESAETHGFLASAALALGPYM